jgi:Recombination endonuclease VII
MSRKLTPTQKKARRARRRWLKKQGPTWQANHASVYSHGHTLEQKLEVLKSQGFRCANPGCKTHTPKPSETLTEWCFDHDHSCCPGSRSCEKCRRGLLCHGCNRALGNLHDDSGRLEGLAKYLRKWERRKLDVTRAAAPFAKVTVVHAGPVATGTDIVVTVSEVAE